MSGMETEFYKLSNTVSEMKSYYYAMDRTQVKQSDIWL